MSYLAVRKRLSMTLVIEFNNIAWTLRKKASDTLYVECSNDRAVISLGNKYRAIVTEFLTPTQCQMAVCWMIDRIVWLQ